MKVSVNWVKQYLDFELPPVDELVRVIGAQLGAVEEVIDLGLKYRGIVVAKVVDCHKHEHSDHLSVCLLDDGGITAGIQRDEHGYIQVVCGAPNVRQGLMVAWLPPGSTVPSTYDNEPFVMEARNLRGVMSNGMIASPKELAISEDHNGILEIEEPVQPGTAFADVYNLNDYIIDIENKMFTHRPDCFAQLGVAREIAGILGHQFTSPEWYLHAPQPLSRDQTTGLALQVRNELPELVPRFMAVAIANVDIKSSPVWLQTYLSRIGIRPINNIVDITNYMMVLAGQPLHAYDYDKVKAQDSNANEATLVVRYPQDGEKIMLLNGKEIVPRKEAIVIASATRPIGMGGVMGGGNTEVDDSTKNIILECATFDMYSIRRTSMAHGLFTDAVTRFNKGQSPLQNDRVLAKTVHMLLDLAQGASVASDTVDDNHLPEQVMADNSLRPAVNVQPVFINNRLGLQLQEAEIAGLLRNVECDVQSDGQELSIKAPFWRTDIELPEDVVEEVGRLYGFDHLPLALPKRDITPAQKNSLLETKARVRSALRAAGANEVLTYSFVHGNLLTKVGQDKEQAFQLSNALSPDLQYFRLSITPSLLEKIHPNIKAGYDEFALFELGKTHIKGEAEVDEPAVPAESQRLSLVFTAADKVAGRYGGAPYYFARNYAAYVASSITGVRQALRFEPLADVDVSGNHPARQMVAPYEPKRSAVVFDSRGNIRGVVGEFKASVRSDLKLPAFTAGFELDILLFGNNFQETSYIPLSRYPEVTQDISLKLPAEMNYQEVFDLVSNALRKVQPENSLPLLEPLDIYQSEDDARHKHVTFRLTITRYDKTLTAKEVNTLLNTVATLLEPAGISRL